jgi:hypothetical protein
MSPGIYILSGISPLAQNVGDFGYFGLSVNPEKRIDQHLSAFRRDKHTNEGMQQFYHDMGKDHIFYSIVEECDIDQLAAREKDYIAQGQTYVNPLGFNLSCGGEGVGVREGKLFSFEDTEHGLFITGQNLAMFQRANPQFDLNQLYRLLRGELTSYQNLRIGPWHPVEQIPSVSHFGR